MSEETPRLSLKDAQVLLDAFVKELTDRIQNGYDKPMVVDGAVTMVRVPCTAQDLAQARAFLATHDIRLLESSDMLRSVREAAESALEDGAEGFDFPEDSHHDLPN